MNMNCKKCGALIDINSNFCPYCGENLKKENTSQGYDDPFKNIRIDNTHSEQYQYQQAYINQNKVNNNDNINKISERSKNPLSLIGLILGLVSIFLCFGTKIIGVGLITAVIAFILSIFGLSHTSRGLGVTAIVVTIFTGIISFVVTIFMFVGNITITFQNNYETTIKDYLIDAFFCGFHGDEIEGYWLNSTNELLYLDDLGNYYIYSDSNELTDNYYYGTYQVEDGYYLNSEEVLYADEDYYYYQIDTMFNKAKVNGEIYYETIDLLENGFTLKLDKDNKDKLVLVSNDKEFEFERKED